MRNLESFLLFQRVLRSSSEIQVPAAVWQNFLGSSHLVVMNTLATQVTSVRGHERIT